MNKLKSNLKALYQSLKLHSAAEVSPEEYIKLVNTKMSLQVVKDRTQETVTETKTEVIQDIKLCVFLFYLV